MTIAKKLDGFIDLLLTLFLRMPIVAVVVLWVVDEMNITSTVGQIIAIIVLVVSVVGMFLTHHPIHKNFSKSKKANDKVNKQIEREIDDIVKVQLFNIANINQDYEVLGMVEAKDVNKEQAKRKLQLQVLELGGDAVINVMTNIDNNVTGSVGSVAGMPRMVSGSTSTVTTYHYEGTAVKLK